MVSLDANATVCLTSPIMRNAFTTQPRLLGMVFFFASGTAFGGGDEERAEEGYDACG